MAKLLICDPIADDALAALRELDVEVDVRDDITADALAEVIGEYDGIVVRSRTKVREPLIDKATRLRVIIRGGVGLDSIDVAYAERKGIDVRNTPRASSNAVAELAVGLMFALARHIPQASGSMKTGRWDKKRLKGTELAGKTLGIIGYGRIGQLLGEKAKALGMNVVAYDPYIEHADLMPFNDLLKAADYVSIHVPHTNETHHLLGETQLAMMKPGAYLIQASRGGTVDEHALYEALTSGHLAGAAVDVYTEEPPQSDELRRLVDLHQVVATPHIGAATFESQGRIGEEIVDLVTSYLT
jgi:D-3-phosphoglycerate dehydrogenase